MAILNPVVVYNATDNIEAHFLRDFLEQNGIEAYASRDESFVGMGLFGLPALHKPQVWVDQTNVEKARPLLEQFESNWRVSDVEFGRFDS